MFRHPFILLSALRAILTVALLGALPAAADGNPPEIETSKRFGRYVVFYNVFASTDLPAHIAGHYGIEQAPDLIVLNVSLRETGDGNVLPQPAAVDGSYSDLIESKPLQFREVKEANGIYYLAQLRVTNRQLLRFTVNVQPPAADGAPAAPLQVIFTRRFAVDD